MVSPTNIPAPRVPIFDERTGLMSREWFRFFSNLYTQVGAYGNTASIQDLELSASGLAADSLTEVQKSLQDLQLSILPQTTSTGGTTYSVFTSTTNGLAPASGGGTSNFLRADGTWAVPPGTGGGITDGDKGDITVSGGATVWTVDAGVITNAKLANVSTATFKGRTTAGSGSPEDLTATQATALLNTFTSTLKGLAPASGGGTTTFLRADGTWAVPSGGGGGTTVNTGSATLDFGAAPGSNEASVAVTGLTTILATSKVQAWIMGDDTSVDHTASDHRYFPALGALAAGTPTAGVGFTIYGRSTQKLTGQWTVRYLWVD